MAIGENGFESDRKGLVVIYVTNPETGVHWPLHGSGIRTKPVQLCDCPSKPVHAQLVHDWMSPPFSETLEYELGFEVYLELTCLYFRTFNSCHWTQRCLFVCSL